MTEVLAWHFTGDTLRDGRPIPPVGETLKHDGDLVMCKTGLHASERAIDALMYAPGHTVHRVKLSGQIEKQGHNDKLVASERTILWSADAENMLRHFARLCALDVIDKWDAPEIVRRYLETGDEGIRNSARAAARNAAWDAAGAAARAAAWDAARDAARVAAWAAAWAAAEDAQNTRLTEMLEALA